MDLLKKIILPRSLIYILFILLHIFLFNINAAEWGDSYRILRASEYIRNDLIYPDDEKRPPVYSLILSLRPTFVDPVFWGRLFMFVVSISFLFLFEKFLKLFTDSVCCINFGLILLALNPVFLYWSIRIYADVFFALLALLSIYLFYLWKEKINVWKVVVLGFLVSLSVLTRFEGYLLFGSLGLGILFLNARNIFEGIKKNFKLGFIYSLSFLLVLLPWFLYRNPFISSYLEEPTGRTYDLKMFLIYLVSILFIFGFTTGFDFIIANTKKVYEFCRDNMVITSFILVELFLVLMWPAAVPRLFVPIIPLLILLLILSLREYFEEKHFKHGYLWLGGLIFLGIFGISQYYLKLQFLVPTKNLFVTLIFFQVFNLYFIFKRNITGFILTTIVSCLFWSLAVIYIHKDIHISVKSAGEYVSNNISGIVAYNDVSSVSDWYLNQHTDNNVLGYYYNFEKDELLTLKSLLEEGMDYLLITNEHNTTMDIDINKRPYLTLIEEFSYNVNGEVFSTKVVKIDKEYNNE